MGKIRRGNYLFVTWVGDHPPRHVHIYKEKRLVAKFSLEDKSVLEGSMNRRLKKMVFRLIRERAFECLVK